MQERPSSRALPASVVRAFGILVAPWLVAGCASFPQAPEASPNLHVLQPAAVSTKAARRGDVTL